MFLNRIIRSNPIKNIFHVSRYSLTTQNVNRPQVAPQLILVQNSWLYRQNERIEIPVPKGIINLPNNLRWLPPLEDPVVTTEIEAPSTIKDTPKQAARLIIIRRKKMKKHKLRKLRKRMKFEWRKLRQKRELRKEKAFQAVLIQQCKDAEAFSAEDYVAQKMNTYKNILSHSKESVNKPQMI